MRTVKFALGAAAAALVGISAVPASAATITQNLSFDSTGLATITAFNASTANTYDFDFNIGSQWDTLAQVQASITVKSGKKSVPVAEPIQLDLYSGTPSGSHTLIDSTLDVVGANLDDVLKAGNYYLELTPKNIAVSGELVSGSIQLSAVPEPASWALMMVGVGGLGLALRSSRRSQAATAAV